MTDEEYLSQLTSVEIYCEILLGVLRYTPVKNYYSEEEYKYNLNRKLKFANTDGHLRLRACIDLTEDSQYAITEIYKNGLKTNLEGQGEMYLRLSAESERKTESFRLTQTSITKWGNELIIVSSFDEIEEFKLIPLMKEFSKKIELYLDIISEKALKSLFPNKTEQRDWMIFRLNYVRNRNA